MTQPPARPRVLLVGRYPPPFGGITVHIQRLQQALSGDCEVLVFDAYAADDRVLKQLAGARVYGSGGSRLGALRVYVRLLATGRFDVVHFHTSAMRRFTRSGLPLLLLARLARTRCILTIHAGGFVRETRHAGVGTRWMMRGLLGLCHHVVAVSTEQRRYLVDVVGLADRRVSVIPAFLPPTVAPTTRYAAPIERWRAAGRRVLCSSGSALPITIYGLHGLIAAVREVDAERPCAVFIAVCRTRDEAYLRGLVDAAGPLPLIISRELPPDELAWVIRHSDLYLRCTDRDGDAIAIREALLLGTPVLASDCVERPAGVSTYATDDAAALVRALAQVLADSIDHGTTPDTGPVRYEAPDTAARLREVYQLD